MATVQWEIDFLEGGGKLGLEYYGVNEKEQ
jgi:hypothetical protein